MNTASGRSQLASLGLEYVLDHAPPLPHTAGSLVQLSELSRRQPPSQSPEIVPGLHQILGPRNRNRALTDTPVDGNLKTAKMGD